jgi:hypothetical protein
VFIEVAESSQLLVSFDESAFVHAVDVINLGLE